mgnify:FL=1
MNSVTAYFIHSNEVSKIIFQNPTFLLYSDKSGDKILKVTVIKVP